MTSDLPLLGYCDRLSGRPGDVIGFKVSSYRDEDYKARLVRVISADPNPDGPGMIEEEVSSDLAGRYPSRPQPLLSSSSIRIEKPLSLAGAPALTLEATIWPTLANGKEQVVLAVGEMALLLQGDGSLGGRLGPHRFSIGEPLLNRHWYRVWFSFDPAKKQVL